MYRAMIAKDIPALSAVLDDSFVLVHMTGMNKYFLHGQLPVISSRYWNMVHGNTPEEVMQDEEGLQIMRQLGRNMAWFLKLKEAGMAAGIPLPEQEEKRIATNFIR